MRNNQILMFGGDSPNPCPVFYPISRGKKCARCEEEKTDFIGLVCVDCVCKSKLTKEVQKNERR